MLDVISSLKLMVHETNDKMGDRPPNKEINYPTVWLGRLLKRCAVRSDVRSAGVE